MARAVPPGMRLIPLGFAAAASRRRAPIAAAALLVALAAGCAGPRYARLRRTDEGLSAAANRSLREAGFSGRSVEARTHGGVVALLGKVGRPEDVRRAERAVEAIPGVLRVNNLILIDEGPPRTAEFAAANRAPIVAARVEPAPGP